MTDRQLKLKYMKFMLADKIAEYVALGSEGEFVEIGRNLINVIDNKLKEELNENNN